MCPSLMEQEYSMQSSFYARDRCALVLYSWVRTQVFVVFGDFEAFEVLVYGFGLS